AEDVFTPDLLARIDRVTRASTDGPYVRRVRSLTNVETFRNLDGDVLIGPLVDELPADATAAAEIRRQALDDPLIRGNLVAPDGHAAAVVIEMDPAGNTMEGKTALVAHLRAAVAQASGAGVEMAIAGSPPIDDAFFRYTERDGKVLGGLAIAVVIAATFFVFRRLSAALIPLAVVILAVIWTGGLMGVLGVAINIVSANIVSLILAVGVADTIHVLADYYQHLMAGEDRDEAVEGSISSLIAPCFFTSATTAAGLLSLLASDLKPVREFGWLGAFGVLAAFVLTMTLVPGVLGFARPPDPAFVERQRSGPLSRLLAWLGRPTPRRSRIVLGLSVPLVALAAVAVSRLDVGSNPVGYFKTHDPVRLATERVDDALGGSTSVEFLVHAPDDGLADPERLARLEDFQRFVVDQPGIEQALSITDALKEIHRVLLGDPPGTGRLPDNRPLAAQLHLMLEGAEDYDTMVQDDASVGRISARASFKEAGELVDAMPELEALLARAYSSEELTVHPTGYVKLMGNMEIYLISSQIQSFLVAFAVVTAMMFFVTRSVPLGLFSMIPNLVPIVLGLGLMWVAGIQLDPGTVMIGSIALGLVVDDTVHFLVRLRRSLADAPMPAAIERTMSQTGRPIIVTSVVLALGFATLGFGSFTPNVAFGVVSAVVILCALLADLLLLPAVLLVGQKDA
ncbi:MAG: MMPL family transporter, partial [Myxococcales bacterium]|nr:MMPL family transporter [Myxococcales bacterium]